MILCWYRNKKRFVYLEVHVFFRVTRRDMAELVSKKTKTAATWQQFGFEANERDEPKNTRGKV